MTILYRTENPETPHPVRGTSGAAAHDIYCAEDTEIEAFKPKLIKTDIYCKIPEGTGLFFIPRSSMPLKHGLVIPNSPGLLDEDYTGQACGIFMYIPDWATIASTIVNMASGMASYDSIVKGTPKVTVKKGDRLAQVMLVRYIEQKWERVSELPKTDRGSGGYGSTGANGAPNSSRQA
jgi:dUTP pyrophosphatase